ncbi:MAG: hypothetical protein ACR2NP_22930 [Pirellulaceae bacterium]
MKSFRMEFCRSGLIALMLTLLLPHLASAQTEESRWGGSENTFNLILTRRADNDAYGTSAFSFRKTSHNPVEHRNYVDLVFNGCGLLHFNPVGGMTSRVADLGEQEDLDVDFDPDEDRIWASEAYLPEEGHVYWQEIKCAGQTMTVIYRVQDVERDEIKLRWTVVEEVEGAEAPLGMAGTMGQCGGQHAAR